MIVKQQSGFTLIEAFIAITILLFAVLGPMSLVSRSIADANYAANQITAFYLAQEGLELVINQREKNESSGKDHWLDGLENCTDGKSCQVWLDDQMELRTSPCPVDRCDPLKLDKNLNLYNYDYGNPSIFTRQVTIEPPEKKTIEPAVETTIGAVLKVTTIWRDNKNQERSFTISTLLTD